MENDEISFRWSDGSYPTFSDEIDSATDAPPHCIRKAGKRWYRRNCDRSYPFVCRLPANQVNTSTLRLEYKRDQLDFSSFQVWYKYRTTNKNERLLKSWKDNRMTGFKLSWNIENKDPPIHMEMSTGEVGSSFTTPGFGENEILHRMTRVAVKKRMMNMSRDDIVKRAVEWKIDLLKRRGVLGSCENEQMIDLSFHHFFEVFAKNQPMELSTNKLSKEDKEIGLALHMIVVHCPKETMKLGQFLLKLVKEESLPSLILTITNTLQSGQLPLYHKRLLGKIYQVLNSIFEFNLDKILLATSTPSQLVALQDQELPFLNTSDLLVEKCTMGQSCDDVFSQIQGQ